MEREFLPDNLALLASYANRKSGFDSRLGHTEDLKNGTCDLSSLGVDKCKERFCGTAIDSPTILKVDRGPRRWAPLTIDDTPEGVQSECNETEPASSPHSLQHWV